MKRSENQVPSKANFRTLFPFNCSNFRLKQCKGLRVTQNVKAIKSEWGVGRVRLKKSFQRQ